MSQYFNSPSSSSKRSFFLTHNIWRANTILAYIHLSITLTWTNSPSLSFPCHPSTLHFLICCVVAYIHSLPVNRVFVCLFFLFLPAVVYLSLSRHSHCVLLMSSLRVVLRVTSFSSFLWTLCREWLSTEVFVVGYTPCSFMFIGCSHLVQSRVVHRCSSSFFCS